MLNHIIKIIWNQRKKNGWIAFELLLIFCLVWYMADYFFVLGYNKSLPSHRDNRNTYMLQMSTYSQLHPRFSEQEAEPAAALANFRRIIDRLREHPDVESIALAPGYDSFPETGSRSDTEYRSADDTTKVADAQFIRFIPEEDYFNVFRHTADNGRKAISAAAYDWNDPSAVLVNRMLEERLFPGRSAVGKIIEKTWVRPDALRDQYRIIGVIDDTKRNPYIRPNAVIFRTERLNEENFAGATIAFRSKSNQPPAQFIPLFKKEMTGKLQAGNYYLQNVSAFTDMAVNLDYRTGLTNGIRLRTVLMVFFLSNIFLCVLGTFWYRVNVRREEIGIRRALGSDARGAGRLFIAEGLLLLTIIVPVAMFIEYQFILAGVIDTMGASNLSYGKYLPDHTPLRFLITNAFTWLIMGSMVFIGAWYPARSATLLKPVDALRDE
jgi:hypothetical protein